MFNELYLSVPQVSCFDGDDANAGDANAGNLRNGQVQFVKHGKSPNNTH